jgi:hypothetical protein
MCCFFDTGEGTAEEMQSRAQQAGLFQAAAGALEACLGMVRFVLYFLLL